MAIQFARCEYVSRSTGGNACRKASYNQREALRCDRTGELFSFKDRGGNVHHEIFLPVGADEKFKNSSVLWNEVERCEKRKDSQVQKEFVLALPDDKEVTLEDRIELARRFINEHFVEKRLGVQLDIHEPDEHEKNWHAHLLVTTRRFSENGLTFESTKARDLDPTIRKGFVVEADVWGELWRDLQNAYFEEKGYDLRVDPISILTQEHLGPVRMRHHMNEAIERSQKLQQANDVLSKEPSHIIEALTRNRAFFSERDINAFLKKHVPHEEQSHVLEGVLSHPTLLPLYDKETEQRTPYFTTQEVRAEEEKLIRFADKITKRSAPILSSEAIAKGLEGRAFSQEQHKAYDLCVQSGEALLLIQGRAGVGKSYVLDAIRVAHKEEGYRVLGLAPTNKVAADLRQSGFEEAKTCHSFLFSYKNNRDTINSNTLMVVDEAAMLGTEVSVELFHVIKTTGAKLVLVGDDRQLSSVERGGMFRTLTERYESVELNEVRRQTIHWQKAVSEDLSKGDIKSAVRLLQTHDRIDWRDTKEEALTSLLKTWEKDSLTHPQETRQILAQRNVEVDALNQGARDILKGHGRLGEVELTCMTTRGKMAFAVGDRIQLTKTDKDQDLNNGNFGFIEQINAEDKTLTVSFDNGEKKTINPQTYDGLRHGYASTVYKAQGATLDHVYVLHSSTTNQATNYVALTRQTQSLSLYVSKDQTPNEAHLIRQMSRVEGNGPSLGFDTEKDIQRKLEEKTFKTHLRDGVENLFTKVKDAFHRNEGFYQVEKQLPKNEEVTVQTQESSPALQAVYKEMDYPAFTTSHAIVVKKAFEKGLKVYGEEKAIAYWRDNKDTLLEPYRQNLVKVENELTSSAFASRTEKWKNHARELAQQDPLKVLESFQKLKDDAAQKLEKQMLEAKPIQAVPYVKQNTLEDTYLRFKGLHEALKNDPDHPLTKDLKHLAQELFQDKDFMKSLQQQQGKEVKLIERIAQEKAHTIALERDRGGLSL
ncbi:MAG TPA: AAA family ATPase [Alphaproteobacteria bacterium]|nr:AAA family ATPase [Alphaproteobacteria bacterium]